MTARVGDASLRHRIRELRRALPPEQRTPAGERILAAIRQYPTFRAARRVALYFAFDGEPDLSSLIRFDTRKEFFAPVLIGGDMHFATIGRHTNLIPNRFGIAEPHPVELIDPRSLDLVLTPLVAFDDSGTRVGVGAGYYDRCFAFLGRRRAWFKPKLTGVCYSLQQVDAIEPNPWDIPLWAVITEHGCRGFRNQ